MGIDRNHEIDASRLSRDTRSGSAKFKDWFYKPTSYRNILIIFICFMIWLPRCV